MPEHDAATDLGRIRLRVSLAWTVKVRLATVGLALFGLLGLFVIFVGVTEENATGVLTGAAMTVVMGGMAVALVVQRHRGARVLELGDFGVRGYSSLPCLRRHRGGASAAPPSEAGTQISRPVVLRCQQRWTVSVDDVVQCAGQIHPQLGFSDTRGA